MDSWPPDCSSSSILCRHILVLLCLLTACTNNSDGGLEVKEAIVVDDYSDGLFVDDFDDGVFPDGMPAGEPVVYSVSCGDISDEHESDGQLVLSGPSVNCDSPSASMASPTLATTQFTATPPFRVSATFRFEEVPLFNLGYGILASARDSEDFAGVTFFRTAAPPLAEDSLGVTMGDKLLQAAGDSGAALPAQSAIIALAAESYFPRGALQLQLDVRKDDGVATAHGFYRECNAIPCTDQVLRSFFIVTRTIELPANAAYDFAFTALDLDGQAMPTPFEFELLRFEVRSTDPEVAFGRNFELRLPTGENTFARWVWICQECTLQQFEAMEAPAGWQKSESRVGLGSSGTVEYLAAPDGIAEELDVIAEIAGAEWKLVAKVEDGTLLSVNPLAALAEVRRDTSRTYANGSTLHELMDPDGNRYALMTASFEVARGVDLTRLGSLASVPLPSDWVYSSRTLAEDLTISSEGKATVLAMDGITWQRYQIFTPQN